MMKNIAIVYTVEQMRKEYNFSQFWLLFLLCKPLQTALQFKHISFVNCGDVKFCSVLTKIMTKAFVFCSFLFDTLLSEYNKIRFKCELFLAILRLLFYEEEFH